MLAFGAQPELSNDILLVDVVAGKSIGFLSGHKQAIRAVAFSADGKTLASTSVDGLKLWNLATLQEMFSLPMENVHNLVFSPRGRFLAFNMRNKGSDGIHLLRAQFPEGK